VLAWIGLGLAAIIALALMLSAGQQNYQSCVQGVTAKYGSQSDPLARLTRLTEVKKCSRSPF
jgi:hypothetical protein